MEKSVNMAELYRGTWNEPWEKQKKMKVSLFNSCGHILFLNVHLVITAFWQFDEDENFQNWLRVYGKNANFW